jgi:Family of unknown function (DUF5681)
VKIHPSKHPVRARVGIRHGDPGESGNPKGKPIGCKHKTTRAIEALLDGEAERLTQRAVDLAMAGDTVALKICLDRLAPVPRDRHVAFPMPEICTAAEAATASAAILMAVGAGQLRPSEGSELCKMLEAYCKTLGAREFEQRLARLEGKQVTLLEP